MLFGWVGRWGVVRSVLILIVKHGCKFPVFKIKKNPVIIITNC